MKKLLLCLGAFPVLVSVSQTSLPANQAVTMNFNSMGVSATAGLPANWKMSGAGLGSTSNWSTATNIIATTQGASNGTPATGGAYNWGTVAGTDRAIGFMTDAAYTAPNSIMAWFRNTTGATLTQVTISFSIERYRINTGTFDLSFWSSSDGNTWAARSSGDVSPAAYPAGSSSYQFSSPQTIYKTVTITGLSIANNGDIYFRWIFSTGSGLTSQGLGLDDVAVFAGPATPAITSKLRDFLQVDNGIQNQFNEGDVIRYSSTTKNTGTGDAGNVQINLPAPPANTTMVPGSIKTSALAKNDSYSTPVNTILTGQNVTANDIGLPSLSIISFGPVANASATLAGTGGQSDNGGIVTVNSDGSFSYTPPAGFIGVDRFAYIASTGTLPNNDAVVTINVGSAVTAIPESYAVIGNVSIVPNSSQGILANDGGTGAVITAINGNNALVGVATTTTNGGNLTVNANGSFTYDPPRGYAGTDNFTYTIDNGFSLPSTATVTFTISGMIWFINTAAPGGGDGRLSAPYNTVAAFQSVNNGSGSNPSMSHNIFVYESATPIPCNNLQLLQNQKLIGQDANQSLSTITSLVPAAYSTPLPVMNAGGSVANLSNAGEVVTLATGGGNLVQGLTLTATVGNALLLSGVASNSNNVTDVYINVSGTANGISLATTSYTGTFNYNSGTITSTGTGTGFIISGSTATVTSNGMLIQSGNGPSVVITNHATGTVTFQTITSTNGNGLQFSNADGIYNFTGPTTLNGGDAGIDILNGSAGTFSFSANTSITSPAGTAFNVDGSVATITAGITYNGTITQNTASQRLININTTGLGTILFQTGTLTAGPNSTGININAVNGNLTLSNGVTLGTNVSRMVNQAITINGGTGIYSLGALSVFTTGASGLVASNADGTVSGTGTIDVLSGSAININGPAGITAVNLGLTTTNSTGGTNNINFTNCSGTYSSGGTLSGASGIAFNINAGTIGTTFTGNITQSSNAALVNVSNGHASGTVIFQTGTLSASNGTGLQFDNADAVYNFNGTTTLNGGDAGIDIVNGSSGTFSFSSATSINNPSGAALVIGSATIGSGSTGTVTYNGTISKTSAGRLIDIQQKTGGTVSFAGAITGTTSNTGVNLAGNTGAIINFTGGCSLNGTASVFAATGGGTISVTGTNSIGAAAAPTVTALTVTNTTIAAAGLTFQSISCSGGANGISLNTTGALGGLTVTGTGSAGTGGTIQNCTASAIFLNSVTGVTLSYMNLTNANEDGIEGTSVTNMNLTNLSITGSGDDSEDVGIGIDNLWGSCTWTNLTVTGSELANVMVSNTSGTLTSFTISGGNFSNLGTAFGSNSILVEMTNTAVLTNGNITGATIANNKPARGVTVQAQINGQIGDAVSHAFFVQNCVFTNNGLQASFEQSGNANLTFKLLNNGTPAVPMTMTLPLTGTSHAVNVFSSSNATGGTIMGTINGNYIGNGAVGSSGSPIGNGIRVLVQGKTDATLLIANNVIRQTPQARGIDVQFLGPLDGSAAPVSDVTITGNDVNPQDNTGFPTSAIYIAGDSQGGGTVTLRCDVRNNTVPAGGAIDVLPTFLVVDKVVAAAIVQLIDNPVGPGGQTPTQQLQSTNTGSSSAQTGVVLITGAITIPW